MTGVNATANCVKCLAGYFSTGNQNTCTSCVNSSGPATLTCDQTTGMAKSCLSTATLGPDGSCNYNIAKCYSGSFSNNVGTCTKCLPGTFTPIDNQPSCTNCLAGTYASSIGATSCPFCATGYWSQDSAAQCNKCTTVGIGGATCDSSNGGANSW